MAINLKIKNIKNLQGVNEFKSLEFVNYLVGKNGSGKTSVLNALALLSIRINKIPALNTFMWGKESEIVFEKHNTIKKVISDGNNINITGTMLLDFVADTDFEDFPTALGSIKKAESVNFDSLEATRNFGRGIGASRNTGSGVEARLFNRIKQSAIYLNLEPIEVKIETPVDPFEETPSRSFFQNGNKIKPKYLAQGIKRLERLNGIFEQILKSAQEVKPELVIVLIEEPENNLHPEAQKILPGLIDSFITENSLNDKVMFFIATHSPFIINSSKNFPTQKVFRIENGKNIDSNGFNGGFKMKEVAMLLGADPSDIGLTDNLCLVEESSICRILNKCKEKGFLQDFNFISCSGVTRTEKFKERIENLSIYNTLFTCHPLYRDSYHIIIDQVATSEKSNQKYTKLTTLGESRFHELKKQALEDYYEDFNNLLFTEFQTRKKSGESIGDLKGEIADKIADKIEKPQDFSNLFKGEIDFLLK